MTDDEITAVIEAATEACMQNLRGLTEGLVTEVVALLRTQADEERGQ